MSLSEDLDALKPAKPKSECSVCWVLRDLDSDDAERVNDAVASGAAVASLAATLRRNGYDVSDTTLRRHIKNGHTL